MLTLSKDLELLRQQAIAKLDASAAKLRSKLANGEVHQRTWEEDPIGVRTKVGTGYIRVRRAPNPGYPGIQYVSSMGANSDDSYSGFLPGVTFDEALLLVYGDWKVWTS